MNVLILHYYNNLPLSVIEESLKAKDAIVSIRPFAQPPTDQEDFDTFVSEELSKISLEQYDLIVMPLNFTETYMEFTGLRVAAHIRLTEEWESVSTPILFLGSEKLEEVLRISQMGVILNTFNVYYLQRYGIEDIKEKLDQIMNTSLDVDANSPQYKRFLEVMKIIPAPSNYTSHHSIANEWAIMRWSEMLSKRKIKLEIPQNDFNNFLYFKYLMAVAGVRDKFNKKFEENNPDIGHESAFENKRIIFIDDELEKGWMHILKEVIKVRSKGELIPYPFEKKNSMSKDELIKNIKHFIKEDYDKNGGADCYILDLRLHDDDFNNDDISTKLSGHIIAEYIKSKDKEKEINPYSQIVIFTASNKVWNYKRAIEETEACGYAVKETPEQNLNRNDTKKLFDEFCKAIAHACKKSYLKNHYKSLENLINNFNYKRGELDLLYQFVELLDIDDERNNDALIKACIITLSTFIEVFCKDRFDITEHELFNKTDSGFHVSWTERVYRNNEKLSVKVRKASNELFPDFKAITPSYKKDSFEIPDIAYFLIPLALYYNLSETELSKVYELKEIRNKVAHEGEADYSKDQLLEVFNIVLKVLEYQNESDR